MVATEAPMKLHETRVPGATSSTSRHRAIALSVAAVWVSVGALSLFAPDLVSGTNQEHLPIAAMGTWFWGGLATGLILLAGAVGGDEAGAPWPTFAGIVAVMWAVVAIAGVWSPGMVVGTDPTQLPLAAMIAPIAGAIGTAFVCVYAAGASRQSRSF